MAATPTPSDPGDFVTTAESTTPGSPLQGCAAGNSTWHGTMVAGTLGAAVNNGNGMSGVNWASPLLNVRVLGKCGGALSDVADGIRWAAGLPVPGVPANPTPARVINLSLAGLRRVRTDPAKRGHGCGGERRGDRGRSGKQQRRRREPLARELQRRNRGCRDLEERIARVLHELRIADCGVRAGRRRRRQHSGPPQQRARRRRIRAVTATGSNSARAWRRRTSRVSRRWSSRWTEPHACRSARAHRIERSRLPGGGHRPLLDVDLRRGHRRRGRHALASRTDRPGRAAASGSKPAASDTCTHADARAGASGAGPDPRASTAADPGPDHAGIAFPSRHAAGSDGSSPRRVALEVPRGARSALKGEGSTSLLCAGTPAAMRRAQR